MTFFSTSSRIRRTVIEQIGAIPENFHLTIAKGLAATDVGGTFCSNELGRLRRYERIAAAPGFMDMGDEAAPLMTSSVVVPLRPINSTDDTAYVEDAIAAVPNGGTLLAMPGSTFRVSSLVATGKSITIDISGSAIRALPGTYEDILTFRGGYTGLGPVTLGAGAAGETTITFDRVPVGAAPNRWLKVCSDDRAPQHGHAFSVRMGQPLRIKRIDGPVVTCYGELVYRSYYQTNVRAALQVEDKCVLIGGRIIGNDDQPTNQIPSNHLVWFDSLVAPEARGVEVGGGVAPGGIFRSCVQARASDCRASALGDLLGGGWGSLNGYMTRLENTITDNTRHIGDSNANSVPSAPSNDIGDYGPDILFEGSGGLGQAASSSALTFHGPAYGARWQNFVVSDSDKVIGARGDTVTWSDIRSNGSGTGIQVVTEIYGATFRRLDLKNLRGQVLVNNQVNGVDQPFDGRNLIEQSRFEFRAEGLTSAFVPVIKAGASLDVLTTALIFTGTESSKSIIRLYGAGSVRLDVEVDLRRSGAVSGINPLRISGALAAVTGKMRVLLASAAQASMISTLVQLDATSAAYVSLEIELVTDDGSRPTVTTLINNSTNVENVFLKTNVGDSANNGFSVWHRRTGVSANDGRIYHCSADPILGVEVFPTASVTGWTLAPGFRRGQRIRVRNSNANGFLFVCHGVTIRAGAECEFKFDGATWAPVKVQILYGRAYTISLAAAGSAGDQATTVISMPGTVNGDPAPAYAYSQLVPDGVLVSTKVAGPNATAVTFKNLTAAAVATASGTLSTEIVR